MVSVKTKGRKIDFVRNCIAESTAYFIISILTFSITPIINIKIFQKTISYLGLERRFLRSFSNLTQSKEKLIPDISESYFLSVSLHCARIQNDHREVSRSKIQRRVRIWQIKTEWSSQRPPVWVRLNPASDVQVEIFDFFFDFHKLNIQLSLHAT